MAVKNTTTLTSKNLVKAREMLLEATSLLDSYNIRYHLEGGTLLGIVRDKDLLPWDHDIDISIPSSFATALIKLRYKFLLQGYKISVRRSKENIGPFRKGEYILFKIKPLMAYLIKSVVPSYDCIVLDVFVKKSDPNYTYWQAANKVMRVENKHYSSYDEVIFMGHQLKTPNNYNDYLTAKYGNWSVPVKEWDCSINELTIVTPEKDKL